MKWLHRLRADKSAQGLLERAEVMRWANFIRIPSSMGSNNPGHFLQSGPQFHCFSPSALVKESWPISRAILQVLYAFFTHLAISCWGFPTEIATHWQWFYSGLSLFTFREGITQINNNNNNKRLAGLFLIAGLNRAFKLCSFIPLTHKLGALPLPDPHQS